MNQKNIVHQELVATLKKKSKKAKAKIWEDIATKLSRDAQVNVGKLNKHTKKNDVVAVPGKVLGGGEITHPVIVGAEKFSSSARTKIEGVGGKVLSLAQLSEQFADGKGVRIIAG